MRTPITLYEFLFVLNQDEDIRVRIIDYLTDVTLYNEWKSDFYNHIELKHKDWYIQDFTCMIGGLEISIVK